MGSKQGFTLIELLVVIAIIGILAAIILASLASARGKGGDAAIQEDFLSIRNQAEIYYYGNSNSYASLCSNTTIEGITNGAQSAAGITVVTPLASGAASSATAGACHAAAATYVIEIPLNSSSANSWCVDSTGASKQETGSANYLAAAATHCS